MAHDHDDHSDDGGYDDHEQDTGEWVQLLAANERRQVQELDRARREIERQMIHANQAKLAGKVEETNRGRPSGGTRTIGGGVAPYSDDLMSNLYSQDVDVDQLAALLPRPGDGEKEKQLPFQKAWDLTSGARFSPWYAAISLAITLAAVGVYLYETTLDLETGGWTQGTYPSWFSGVEDFFLVFFLGDLLAGAVMADHDSGFWMTKETIVEVLSVLPSLLFVAFDLRLWGFLRLLRALRWSDVATLEARRARYQLISGSDEGQAKPGEKKDTGFWSNREAVKATVRLVLFVVRYVLVVAGVAVLLDRTEGGIEDISASDPEQKPLSFANAVYMSTMLLTTVGEGGYGPVPVSEYARVLAAFAVLVFLPLAAVRVGDVVRHSDTSEDLMRSRTRTPAVRERHVVALGTITEGNLRARLKEIFHVDHGKHKVRWVRVVVLSPDPPSRGVRALLDNARYRGFVTYVQGSALDDDSLRKAGVTDAAAVMVLANKLARSSHVEDMNVSLQAISVMTYVELQRRQGWGPRLLVELVDPNAALHLRAAGIKQVVSSDQLKLSVLAQSCLCPGWSAVVANLLESRTALPPQVLEQGSWLAEYYVGAKKTFYSVEFSPNFAGMLFDDAVVHIFELFELILVAVESRRAGAGDPIVLVNPSGGYRIGRGDRGFVLAESQADARVIWDYMARAGPGGIPVELSKSLRFESPEEEEASALETLGTAGIASMGPRAFVDSMIFSRTLLQCQRRLPAGESTDPSLVLEWARQFQESDGMTNEQILSRLAVGEQARQSGGASAIPSTPARGGARAQQNDGGERVMGTPKRALNGSEEYDGGEPTATMILSALRSLKVSSLDGDEACRYLKDLQTAAEVATAATPTVAMAVNAGIGSARMANTNPSPGVGVTPTSSRADQRLRRRSSAVAPDDTSSGADGGFNRRIKSARHMKGHVVVVGFPSRPSHLECFLRPLKGWTGGSDGEGGGRGVPVVLVAKTVDQLEGALEVVDRTGQINTRDVYLLEGSPVSHRDLENAGVKSAKAVIVMKDPRRRLLEGVPAEEGLLDAEALVTFTKMEDGLLTRDQHVVVELESSSNVRFLHARSDGRSLHAISGLGGAGGGGAADDAHYLWPKYAAGMTYNASFLDSLFGQAFYRPSRLALIERLLLLDRGDYHDTSRANLSTHRRRRQAATLAPQADDPNNNPAVGHNSKGRGTRPLAPPASMVREACLRQMEVPPSFLEHSFGELFQHLAAPPLRCVAFALRRARGTRNAPEPYVYTGPRADTVLHAGDRVFVLGCAPEL